MINRYHAQEVVQSFRKFRNTVFKCGLVPLVIYTEVQVKQLRREMQDANASFEGVT